MFSQLRPALWRGKCLPISKTYYSWEKRQRRRGKPFYKRKLLWIPLGILCLGAFAAWVAFGILSYRFEKRAEEFDLSKVSSMEAASVLYDRNGRDFGKIFIQNRQPVPYDRISPMLTKAVIAAEDNKFYEHDGVDYFGIMRAMIANYRRGKISQGASTVTQQLARNSFDMHARTYERKIVEMFLSWRIEKNFKKERIMELYLNRVYFGSGFYGAEAAARGYFGRPAKDLDIGQCAMLAGLLKSPQSLSPWNNIEGATDVRNFVLRRMREMGFITKEQMKEQIAMKLYAVKRMNPFKISYAVDMIRQQAIKALGFDRAMNGGYRIETTLDSDMQRVAERATRDFLSQVESVPGYAHPTFAQYRDQTKEIEDAINKGNMAVKMPEPKYIQGAALALDNATGGVLAMVGGRDFKHSEYNRAFQGTHPLGTAFTPLVFAAAYESGTFPGEIVQDACIDNRYVMVGGETGILGEWGRESRQRIRGPDDHPRRPREGEKRGHRPAGHEDRLGCPEKNGGGGGYHLAAPRLHQQLPGKQRDHPRRDDPRVHDLPQRRPARERGPHHPTDSGRRRQRDLRGAQLDAESHLSGGGISGPRRVGGDYETGGWSGCRNRTRPRQVPGGGKIRRILQFLGRLFFRLYQRRDLRGLGGL